MPQPDRIELSDLLRELEQGSAAVRRNAVQVKDALYGSSPENSVDKSLNDSNSAIGVIRQALHEISRANDELIFLRDSCNLAMKGGQANGASINNASTMASSRY